MCVAVEKIQLDRQRVSVSVAVRGIEAYESKINTITRASKLLCYGLLAIVGLLESTCVSFQRELDAAGLSMALRRGCIGQQNGGGAG